MKAPSEEVATGEELVEIETDKATMTYESPQSGVLGAAVAEGTTHPVGAVIATVGAGTSDDGPETRSETGPGEAAHPIAAADPVLSNGSESFHGSQRAGTARATPLARRVAAAHGLELAAISGNGPARAHHPFRCRHGSGLADARSHGDIAEGPRGRSTDGAGVPRASTI